jgi:hypothetical protein
MISEILVPFGVMLHWTKFFDVKGQIPIIVSVLGFFVITLLRVPIMLRLLYLFLSGMSQPVFSQIRYFVHGAFLGGVLIALFLDLIWGKLYFSNIFRLLKESKQKK